jgi:hypothetical protein
MSIKDFADFPCTLRWAENPTESFGAAVETIDGKPIQKTPPS